MYQVLQQAGLLTSKSNSAKIWKILKLHAGQNNELFAPYHFLLVTYFQVKCRF